MVRAPGESREVPGSRPGRRKAISSENVLPIFVAGHGYAGECRPDYITNQSARETGRSWIDQSRRPLAVA